jgi:amylosucrase
MMEHAEWLEKQAQLTMARLLPRCQPLLKKVKNADVFQERMRQEFPRLFGLLYNLYGNHYDFFYHLEQILLTAAQMFVSRPSALRALDREREANPLWFQSEKMVGGVCYVDLFAGNLTNMHAKIPYFKELGLTYLHLMPLFAVPERNNDGGYAISDYRAVNPKVGTMEQLADFATALREEGISLVLDFVFNHTSDEHEWAQRAVAGDETYQGYYFMFPDRTMPDAYERTLREIFPEQAPGNFTYNQQAKKWVWTSFWSFQWDLNYQNPAVFNAMLGEMLFLANQGIQVLRLDAVAFIWKQMGTACENLPQAHMIIQAYNALLKIVAPAMIFKSEAIVHPDDVASYISWNEAPLSYNPTLMALLWEALATRNVNLLQLSMAKRFGLPREAAWVNYVRVHDDIGWTFADEDAAELWINGFDHRQFLNQFYSGEFDDSFAKGVPFGVNPRTKDMRIAGTGASLAGLEQAIERGDEHLIEMALRRWLLLHSIILSAGGIPLIYLGDEIATLNDYSYVDDPQKKDDSRWVHRPFFKWERAEKRQDASTIAGRMFQGVQRMIAIRKQTAAMGSGISTFFPTQNPHVLGFIRSGQLLVLANFSEQPQMIARDVVAAYSPGFRNVYDLLAAQTIEILPQIELQPYEFRWLLFEK